MNGYRVLPVKPGTNAPPLISGFSKLATTDPKQVAKMWDTHPDANPGVATAKAILIVDCDTAEAVRRVRELGVPEETPTVNTPRGGRHFYLRGRGPSKTAFLPDVDLKGTGGYAVGPGARRVDGRNEWEVPPWEVIYEAAIPGELELLIEESTRTARTPVGEIVLRGSRNHLTRVGGAMQRAVMSAEVIRAALHSENLARCSPASIRWRSTASPRAARRWKGRFRRCSIRGR